MGKEDILPRYRMGYIWAISLVAAMGGLLFGYDWVVIGGAKPFYEKFFDLTSSAQVGWAMSCALIGCLLGAVLSGGFSDRFGRKRLLILAGGCSSRFPPSERRWPTASPCSSAGASAAVWPSGSPPIFRRCTSPRSRRPPIRGKFVSINQLTIVIGILAAQLVNWLIAQACPAGATAAEILNSWNGQTGGAGCSVLTAVPSLLFFVFMFFVPESPRWLAKNGKDRSGADSGPDRRRAVRGHALPTSRRRWSTKSTRSISASCSNRG